MSNEVIILSGLPGSGKSTYARQLEEQTKEAGNCLQVFSADHFFLDDAGNYNFDVSQIGKAHAECYRKFLEAVQQYTSPDKYKNDIVLLVDNTNLSAWEISPYVQVASAYEMPCKIVTIKCSVRNLLTIRPTSVGIKRLLSSSTYSRCNKVEIILA